MAAEDESEFLKLPVEDRCIHKLWKARVNGYEEAVKLFARWDGDDANWKKFSPNIKKFVADSNAVAQEKGLEAALAYSENCDAAPKQAGDIVDGLVTKCLGAPKAKTKDLGKQVQSTLTTE
jgi:cytoskeleton-associated protein 5